MSEFLAEASVLIRPDVTKFRAALEAELTAATRGVVVPVAVAPVTTGPAFKSAVSSSNALAAANSEVALSAKGAGVALTQEAGAAQVAGASMRKFTIESAAAAAGQEQLRRGFLATALSMLGIRGATLAAGQAFLIGAAGATVLAKATQGAAEDQEALAEVTRQLGPQLASRLQKNTEDLAVSFGLVDDEVLRFQASISQVFKSVGLSSQQTAQFSSDLVKLAADVAAVKDVAAGDVFEAFRSGLAGNVRSLKQFLGAINATIINERALRDTGKDQVSQLTEQEKVLARLEVIQERAARFTGGFAEEQGRLAGQSKILRAEIDNLGDSLGGLLLGPVTNIVHVLNLGAGAFISLKDAIAQVNVQIPIINKSLFELINFFPLVIDLTSTLATKGFKSMGESGTSALERIAFQSITTSDDFRALKKPIDDVVNLLIGMGKAAEAGASGLDTASQSARLFASNLSVLQGQLLDLEFQGASPTERISKLFEILGSIQDRLTDPGTPSGQKAGLRQQRNQIQAQIESVFGEQIQGINDAAAKIQDQLDAQKRAQEEAARAAKEAAQLAQQQRDAFDQSIQDAIDRNQAIKQLAIIDAESTPGLLDDIKAQIQLRNLIRRQIAVLVPQIKDVETRNRVRLELVTAEKQTEASIKALFEQRQKNREEARKEAEAALAQAKADALEGLRLKVEIAEAEGNTKKQIAALQRLIRAEEKQLATMKKDNNAKKQLQLQIARDKAALQDLTKEAKDQSGAARDFFEFLQKQQGFAVSLLGNLFPAGAASSALAKQQAATPKIDASNLFPQGAGPTGVGDVTGALAARAQIQAGAPRGTTQGQTQTVIEILRQILRVLQVQGRATADPEARFNRASGSAVMDIM